MESRIQKLTLISPAELFGGVSKPVPKNNQGNINSNINNSINLKGLSNPVPFVIRNDSLSTSEFKKPAKNIVNVSPGIIFSQVEVKPGQSGPAKSPPAFSIKSSLVPLTGLTNTSIPALPVIRVAKSPVDSNQTLKASGVIINNNLSAVNSSARLGGIPPRAGNAMTGSQFIEKTRGMSRDKRENLILQEIMKGNVPDFARNMQEIKVSAVGKDGLKHTAAINVMPDYLAIGSNQDFVRIPMNPLTAQHIADQTGTILPTRKLVNDVYNQAQVKLKPQPLPAGSQMMSNEYYEKHNKLVEQQRNQNGAALGQLTAGHQKDVVLSNKLDAKPGRVAIYGWHQPNGKPIQPLSTVHENTYADYSHGVRLINATMIVDGVKKSVADVMKDPNLAALVSDEGVIRTPRIST